MGTSRYLTYRDTNYRGILNKLFVLFCIHEGYFQDNILCHFGASMISGLVTTIASMPVDIAKTRFVEKSLSVTELILDQNQNLEFEFA